MTRRLMLKLGAGLTYKTARRQFTFADCGLQETMQNAFVVA
jgi:hypothetical protein